MLEQSKLDTLEDSTGLFINGKYEIVSQISEDQLSTSYQVKQNLNGISLTRNLELKVYRAENFFADWVQDGILEQIKNSISFHSRNILSCLEYGEWNSAPYTVHDLFQGITLEKIIQERETHPISSKSAVSCTIEILKALESLYTSHCEFKYSSHFVHASLTPEKILISQDTGLIMLRDTGNIGLYSRASLNNSSEISFHSNYLSPEQLMLNSLSIASDLYSVGLILLDLLTPHYREKVNGLTQAELYLYLTDKLLEELNLFELNDELVRLMKKALHPDASERFQAPAFFIAELNAFLRKQYWVFDIQDNIKTMFCTLENHPQEQQRKPQFEANKTLKLSAPAELVNSLPLEELTENLPEYSSEIKEPENEHLVESFKQTEEINPIALQLNRPEILPIKSQTMTLSRFTPPPVVEEEEEQQIKQHTPWMNKKILFVGAGVFLVAALLIKIIASPHNQITDLADEKAPKNQIKNELVNTKVQENMTKPQLITVSEKKENTLKPIVTLPEQKEQKPKVETKTRSEFARGRINAIPYATVDIPAIHMTGEITPLLNVKFPVGKKVVLSVKHGKCTLNEVVEAKQDSSLDLRFNMNTCKIL